MNVVDPRHADHALHNEVDNILDDIVGNEDQPVVAESRANDGAAVLPDFPVLGKKIVRQVREESAKVLL